MKWPWSRPEVRSSSYADKIVSQIMASASGASDGGALGALETASRLWGAGLSSVSVSPDSLALRSVTAPILDSIGRSLCRSGEALFVISVSGGRVRLIACGSWDVSGNDDPESWTYRCQMSGPSSTRTLTLDADSVLHVRYAASPAAPWRGRSPVRLAIDTARAAGLLETATAGELNFTQSQMLTPRRSAGDFGVADSLNPETISKIVTAFSEHVNTGAFVLPADVTPQRLGPEPPDSFALLRDRFENSILAMCGIPPALVAAQANGQAMREAARQALNFLLRPLGTLVVEELQAKLDPDAALSFDSLRAGDITGSARAFGSLVTGGLTPKSAAEVVGLEGVDVREVPA